MVKECSEMEVGCLCRLSARHPFGAANVVDVACLPARTSRRVERAAGRHQKNGR